MATNNVEIVVSLRNATTRGLRAVNQSLNSLQKSAESVSSSILNLKNALIGFGAVAGVNQAVQTFAAFDDQMRSVGAISGATAEQFAAMTAQAQELGATTRYSATQAGEGLQFLAQAGFDAEKAMTALPGVLDLAAASQLDLGQASDITTNVLSGMQLPIHELARVNDVLTKAAHSANTSVLELGEGMKIAGPAAKGSGLQLEEVVSVMGGLANNGIRGAEAGHAIKRMLIALQAPTAKTKAALADMNIETHNIDGSFRGLLPVLTDMTDKNIDLAKANELFGKFTATSGIAAIGAAKDIDVLNNSLKSLADDGFTYASKTAEKMEAGTGGAIRALKSAWEGLQIAFATGIDVSTGDVIQYLTTQIRDLIGWITNLSNDGTLQSWANTFGTAIKETIENLKVLAGIVASTFEPFIRYLVTISPEIITVTAAIAGFSGGLKIVLGITGSVASAFTGLTTAASAFSNVLLGMNFSAWFTAMQNTSRYIGVAQVAMASFANAVTVAAGVIGVAFAAVQIGKFLNQFEIVRDTVQGTFKILDQWGLVFGSSINKNTQELTRLIAETQKVIDKYNDFKNVEIPDDLADKPLKDITELHNELKKSKAFWDAYITQLEATNDGSSEMAAKIREAKDRFAEIQDQIQNVANVMSNYTTATEQELKNSSEAHKNHVQTVQKLTDELVKKEIESRKKAFSDVEKLYAEDKISYEQLASEREKITAKSEDNINKIRIDYAKQIEGTAAEAVQVEKDLAVERTNILNEQLDAGLVTRKDYSEKYQEIAQQAAGNIARIETDTAKAASDEVLKINKEQVAEFLKNNEDRVKQSKSILDQELAEIELAEQKKVITAEQALNEREKITLAHYEKIKNEADANFKNLKGNYTSDQDEFQKSLGIKNAATQDFTNIQAQFAEERNKIAVEKEKEKSDQIQAIESALTEQLSAEYQKQVAEIELAEQKGEITHQEAVNRKFEAEKKFLEDKVNLAKEAVDKAAVEYGKDSTNYINAVNEKIAAETQLTQHNAGEIKQRTEDNLRSWDEYRQNADNMKQQLAEARESVISLEQEFGTAGRKMAEVPIQVSGDSGQGAVPFHEAIGQVSADYAALKQKFESEKISGEIGIGIQQDQLVESSNLIKSAFDTLFSDLTNKSNQYKDGFAEVMSQGAGAAKTMATEVIASGQEMINSLKSQLSVLSDQIKSIESEISGISETTAEKIRGLNQELLSDHEKWLADKAEADRLYAEAQFELEQGNFEKSKELMLQSQELSESLAREVQDANGETILSLQETTQTAIDLVQRAGDGATQALTEQKAGVQAQQAAVRTELAQTESVVNSMKEVLSAFSTAFTAIFEKLGIDVKEEMAGVKSAIEEPSTPVIDIDPAKAALQELAQEAQQRAAQAYKALVEAQEGFSTTSPEFKRIMSERQKYFDQQYKKELETYENFKSQIESNPVSAIVEFKGKASPIKPLSETVRDVIAKIQQVQSVAARGANMQTQMNAPSQPTVTNEQAGSAKSFFDMKDVGKLDVTMGGQQSTIVGNSGFLGIFKSTLRRETLTS